MNNCKFPDCSREYRTRGYCKSHYKQLQRNGYNESKLKPLKYVMPRNEVPDHCKYINPNTGMRCDKAHNSKGYCQSHYRHFKISNYDHTKLKPIFDPNNRDLYYEMVLENYPELKTREEINKRHKLIGITHFWNPYLGISDKRWCINIFYNNSNKPTSRYFSRHLMELKECRRLKSDGTEDVDHIDENKLNDNINNLQILTNSENTIKTRKHKHGNYYKAIYEFVCPVCGEFTKRRLMHVNGKWKQNGSGPTCSPRCSYVLMSCKSLNNGQFKSTNDDVIERFINNRETEENRIYIQFSLKDINKLKEWRLYFKNRKIIFNERINHYNNLDNQPDPSDSIINLGKELLNYYKNNLTLYDNFYKTVKNKLPYLIEHERIIFIYITLHQLDIKHNTDMAYNVYKYFNI